MTHSNNTKKSSGNTRRELRELYKPFYKTPQELKQALKDHGLKMSDIDITPLEDQPRHVIVHTKDGSHKFYFNQDMYAEIQWGVKDGITIDHAIWEFVLFDLDSEYPFIMDDIATDLYDRQQDPDKPQPYTVMFFVDHIPVFRCNSYIIDEIAEEEVAKHPEFSPQVVRNVVHNLYAHVEDTLADLKKHNMEAE